MPQILSILCKVAIFNLAVFLFLPLATPLMALPGSSDDASNDLERDGGGNEQIHETWSPARKPGRDTSDDDDDSDDEYDDDEQGYELDDEDQDYD